MATGVVRFWDDGKGFGYIRTDAINEDVFLHFRALANKLRWPSEGSSVEFEIVERRGEIAADQCRILRD